MPSNSRARLGRVERRLPPQPQPPRVDNVLPLRPSDTPEYADLPDWVCCHSDGTNHVGIGSYLCPLSTPGAPALELTGRQAVAVMRQLREQRAAARRSKEGDPAYIAPGAPASGAVSRRDGAETGL